MKYSTSPASSGFDLDGLLVLRTRQRELRTAIRLKKYERLVIKFIPKGNDLVRLRDYNIP